MYHSYPYDLSAADGLCGAIFASFVIGFHAAERNILIKDFFNYSNQTGLEIVNGYRRTVSGLDRGVK